LSLHWDDGCISTTPLGNGPVNGSDFFLGLLVQPIVFRAILVSPWLRAVPFLLVEPSHFLVDEPSFWSVSKFCWFNPKF
jgi:hypothetical protein